MDSLKDNNHKPQKSGTPDKKKESNSLDTLENENGSEDRISSPNFLQGNSSKNQEKNNENNKIDRAIKHGKNVEDGNSSYMNRTTDRSGTVQSIDGVTNTNRISDIENVTRVSTDSNISSANTARKILTSGESLSSPPAIDCDNEDTNDDTVMVAAGNRPPYGSSNYQSLKLLGISRRKVQLLQPDADESVDNQESDSGKLNRESDIMTKSLDFGIVAHDREESVDDSTSKNIPITDSSKTLTPDISNNEEKYPPAIFNVNKDNQETGNIKASVDPDLYIRSQDRLVTKLFDPVSNVREYHKDSDFDAENTPENISLSHYKSRALDVSSEANVIINLEDADSLNERSPMFSNDSDNASVIADSSLLTPEDERLAVLGSTDIEMHPETAKRLATLDFGKIKPNVSPEISSTTVDSVSGALVSSDVSEDNAKSIHSAHMIAGKNLHAKISNTPKLIIADYVPRQANFPMSHSSFSDSPINEEEELYIKNTEVRRSSSLKFYITPPGSPQQRKMVSFADNIGLDLTSVRQFDSPNSPPTIPPAVLANLMASFKEKHAETGMKYLSPNFNQPGASRHFIQKVCSYKISLENVVATDLTITGFIRALNIYNPMNVKVRYTVNVWSTFQDVVATYVENFPDTNTNRFSFMIVAPANLEQGSRLELAVVLDCDGVQYWDNNNGKNYSFDCFIKYSDNTDDDWWEFISL